MIQAEAPVADKPLGHVAPRWRVIAVIGAAMTLGPTSCSHSAELEHFYSAESLYLHFNGNVRELLDCSAKTGKPVIVAHRGGAAPGYAENGMRAIERVSSRASVMVEVDVYHTEDGVNFLHHDADLNRTTTGAGKTTDRPWEWIAALNLRDPFARATTESPVSLKVALGRLSGRAFLMLDLKSPSSDAQVVDQLLAADMLDATIFIAYNEQQAQRIRRVSKDAVLAISEQTVEQLQSGRADLGPYVIFAGVAGSPLLRQYESRSRPLAAVYGTYIGEDPVDARLETGADIPEFTEMPFAAPSLVVSNRPLSLHQYFRNRGLAISPSDCLSSD